MDQGFPNWKNYTIPYRFQRGFPEDLKKTFWIAIRKIHRVSCVYFIRKSKLLKPTANFLLVKHKFTPNEFGVGGEAGSCRKTEKCHRYLLIETPYKDNNKRQESIGVMLHELFHVLGMAHTQKRSDRLVECFVYIIQCSLPTEMITSISIGIISIKQSLVLSSNLKNAKLATIIRFPMIAGLLCTTSRGPSSRMTETVAKSILIHVQ